MAIITKTVHEAMIRNRVFFFLMLTFVLMTSVDACSDSLHLQPNVCLFDASQASSLMFQNQTTCQAVNQDPFSVDMFGAPPGSDCYLKMIADGNACITLMAKWQCSVACRYCNELACLSYAQSLIDTCQQSRFAGCFSSIGAYLPTVNNGSSCMDLSTNLLNIVTTTTPTTKSTSTTTTKSTTTPTTKSTTTTTRSTTTTTTITSTTSEAHQVQSLMIIPFFLFIIISSF